LRYSAVIGSITDRTRATCSPETALARIGSRSWWPSHLDKRDQGR
jgi:hypothetical protein